MASIWERLGERVGYGLAVVVLGPQVALERRARRQMRGAFAAWCGGLGPMVLEARKGDARRALTLATRFGAVSAEAELRPFEKRANLSALAPQLPPVVRANVSRARSRLDGVRYRVGAPTVVSPDGLRAFSATLRVDDCEALVASIGRGSLGRLEMFDLELGSERLELSCLAPTTVDGWDAIGRGFGDVWSWLAERWPASYRS